MCCIQSARACVCVCVEWCWVWHERFHSRGRSFGSSSPCIFRVCSEFRERASARAGHKLLRRRKFRVKVRVLVFTDVYREVSGLTKVWTKAYTFLFLSVLMELFRVYVCGNVWISSVCLALPENWLEKQIVRSRFSGFIPYGKYLFFFVVNEASWVGLHTCGWNSLPLPCVGFRVCVLRQLFLFFLQRFNSVITLMVFLLLSIVEFSLRVVI